MLTGLGHAVGLGSLLGRWRPPTGQCVGEEAHIKQQLQHALLRDCPVQRASELQRLSAAAQSLQVQILAYVEGTTLARC